MMIRSFLANRGFISAIESMQKQGVNLSNLKQYSKYAGNIEPTPSLISETIRLSSSPKSSPIINNLIGTAFKKKMNKIV